MCPNCMSVARYLRETSRATRVTCIYVNSLTLRALYGVHCRCTLRTCEPVQHSDTRGPDRYQRTQEVVRIIVDPYDVCAARDSIIC